MDIAEAARQLSTRLLGARWLTAVGVGQYQGRPAIFVYVTVHNKKEMEFLKHGWHGFDVVVVAAGRPMPALLSTHPQDAPYSRRNRFA